MFVMLTKTRLRPRNTIDCCRNIFDRLTFVITSLSSLLCFKCVYSFRDNFFCDGAGGGAGDVIMSCLYIGGVVSFRWDEDPLDVWWRWWSDQTL